MRFETRECPCWRARPTEGPQNHPERPDDDCSFCDGIGEATYMVPTNPRNVRIGKR